jgi:hypothetical protein
LVKWRLLFQEAGSSATKNQPCQRIGGEVMARKIFGVFLIAVLSLGASIAMGAGLELSYFLGMKDGSENSEGVVVTFAVEAAGQSTVVSEESWAEQAWSDMFVADLNPWSGQTITLKLMTDPGVARNTGWDWILIADAKVTADGALVHDIGQAVADGIQETSVLFDGENNETAGLPNGANCSPDGGTVGGETMPKSFMQHVPWDGKVGNTISRYAIELPAIDTTSVQANGKLTTTWGQLKGR